MAATVQRASRNGHARVFIADDHPIVRQGIAQIVRHEGDMEVCGEADCPEKALQSVSALQPDIAVVDLALTAGSGLGLVRDLKVRHPGVRVLVLSMHDESLYAERVLRAGASGYIMKHEITEHFIATMPGPHSSVWLLAALVSMPMSLDAQTTTRSSSQRFGGCSFNSSQ